ncbi:hypothetical protein [Novosphingobium sp.]|uniref:hypothetical protein n=1 Tax=Novosphingobium sp. TaxID=1874826 RepID=UPI003D129442
MKPLRADNPAQPQGFDRLIRWRDAIAAPLTRWFGWFDSALNRPPAWIGAIAFVLVLQIVLTTQHRPWLDEWQALQLAVQSPRLSDLMFNLRYEGHPPLWYLILRGLAPLFSDPARALPAAALLIAIPVQLTILLAAPFSRAERMMLALSEFVMFEYLTLSRSLTLGIALMFAVAALWKRPRLVWLMIALLPLCDFLFGVVSLVFVVLRWRERRICWPGVALWMVCGLFAAWSIRPMPDIASALVPRAVFSDIALWLANMGTMGLPLQWNGSVPQWNSPPPLPLIGLALFGFFAVAGVELRKKPDFAWAFGAVVSVMLVFNMTVYLLSIRHLSIAAALLIILVWRMSDDGVGRSVWWRTWLLAICACGLFTAVVALVEPFDTAPEAITLIKQLGLRDKTWVSFPHSDGQGIAAREGLLFERLSQHCSEDFIRWNAPDEHSVRSIDALNVHLRQKVAQDGRFYLLSSYLIAEMPPLVHRIGQVSRRGYNGQSYYLYVVGQNHPDARPHQQLCNGPHLPLRH